MLRAPDDSTLFPFPGNISPVLQIKIFTDVLLSGILLNTTIYI